jgi:hypothetical protein
LCPCGTHLKCGILAHSSAVCTTANGCAENSEDRIMSALDLNIGLMVLLEDLAKEHYDGHFTIMKLGPVWRVGFGTPLDRDGMIAWAFGKTFAEAAIASPSASAPNLMEIVEDRHGRGSMLITSQLAVATWHEVIGEPTLGDAILDRIVHNAYRLELDGPSMRKIKAGEATEPGAVRRDDCSRWQGGQGEQRNEAQRQPPGRPRGSTGTSRARRCVSRGGTPQRARVPPIDYGDGFQRA